MTGYDSASQLRLPLATVKRLPWHPKSESGCPGRDPQCAASLSPYFLPSFHLQIPQKSWLQSTHLGGSCSEHLVKTRFGICSKQGLTVAMLDPGKIPSGLLQLSMTQQPSLPRDLLPSIRRGPYSQAPPTWKKPSSDSTQSGAPAVPLVLRGTGAHCLVSSAWVASTVLTGGLSTSIP